MAHASTVAIALMGILGRRVDVEVHVSSGLPAFRIIGLPDAALGEAVERVRAALQSTGCPLPPQRVTVNLSPASLPKHGSGFDLAIAAGILAGAGLIDPSGPASTVHVGEVGLDGGVRRLPGVLPVVAAAQRAGFARIMVPAEAASEASLVEGIEIIPVASLRDVALHYGAEPSALVPAGDAAPAPPIGSGCAVSTAAPRTDPAPAAAPATVIDLADVIGNETAVRALEIAAAGGHHFMMVGPPGAGKTMLAERLRDVLPDLDADRAIEVAAVRSVLGLPVTTPLDRRPPMQSPHHTASSAALLGGGSGAIRPGAVSLASEGVLFLDEAPEFHRAVLDALRQSLESGTQVIHRQSGVAEYPARYQLVLAANPCPCGEVGPVGACECLPAVRRRYASKLSGPLLDRIDVQLRVERVSGAQHRVADAERAAGRATGTTTAQMRERVARARAACAQRLRGTPWRINREVPGVWLRASPQRLASSATVELDAALDRGQLTMRGNDRVLRVAWSIADLEGASRPTREHVREALFYRRAS